jgi:hypothetical protein
VPSTSKVVLSFRYRPTSLILPPASSWAMLGHVLQTVGSLLYFAVCPRRHARHEFAGHGTETRLSLLARPNLSPRRPLIFPPVGALAMSVCYLRDDNQIDAERCRISLRDKSRVTPFTLNGTVEPPV